MTLELTHELIEDVLFVVASGAFEEDGSQRILEIYDGFLSSGGRKILLDRRELETPIATSDADKLGADLAAVTQGKAHKIAVLAPADDITHKIGMATAHREGARVVAFANKSEALLWLHNNL